MPSAVHLSISSSPKGRYGNARGDTELVDIEEEVDFDDSSDEEDGSQVADHRDGDGDELEIVEDEDDDEDELQIVGDDTAPTVLTVCYAPFLLRNLCM